MTQPILETRNRIHIQMSPFDPFDPAHWCGLALSDRRELLAQALHDGIRDVGGIRSVTIEVGPVGREYDLTAAIETDVGRLRTSLWSHARATIFCDASIHAANRRQYGPDRAVKEATERLRPRLAVPYRLESRGLSLTQRIEEGVERTWTAEHALFRKRTAVIREDVVDHAADLDVRDLLAHFYTGPALRLVSESGEAILLPDAIECEGEMVTLCRACTHWSLGSHATCPECTSPAVDTVIAARPPKR